MYRQISMFRELGLGNFHELVVEVSKNPAMIYWLDNNYNHKDEPNENWGRELLELFTMGQGNYTEKDVFECARAFTGWTISPKPPTGGVGGRHTWDFLYRPDDHDDGEKDFLGQKGRFNGEDVIDIIVRQPATARFIARHLYNFFVADEDQVATWLHTPPRDPVAVNIIADAFVSSGYMIKDTLRVLFNSDFFKEARYQRVKSPAEVVGGTMRLVGDFVYPRPGLEMVGFEASYMGQFLCDPPSVEGWHYGAEWIDSGALVKRINFCADAVSNIDYPGIQAIIHRVKAMGTLLPGEDSWTLAWTCWPPWKWLRTHELSCWLWRTRAASCDGIRSKRARHRNKESETCSPWSLLPRSTNLPSSWASKGRSSDVRLDLFTCPCFYWCYDSSWTFNT